MTTTLAEAREMIKALEVEDLRVLSEEITSMIKDAELTDTQKAWFAEAKRRHSDYKAGKTQGIPAEKVFAELRQTP